jgi:hypothetical protein
LVAFDHYSGQWSRLKGGLRPLFGLQTAGQSDENQRQSRFQVEPLEPRILLSGDPVAGELARLLDNATHAMFVNDHAAIVEQLKTEIVADAGHADHDSQGVVVSGSHVGDERGVEWPSGWTGPPVAAPASVAEVKTANSALAADMVGAATAEIVPVTPAGDQVGVAPLSETYLARGPPVATLATVAEVGTANSALAADIMGAATAEVVTSAPTGDQVGVAPLSDSYLARGPPVTTLATVAEVETANSALAASIMGVAITEVVTSAPAGDQGGVAPLSDSYFARGPPVATLATVAEAETSSSALAADTLDAATAEVVTSARAGNQVGVAPLSDTNLARGPPSADYLLADASSPLASTPSALSTADLKSFALAMWSDALAANGLSLPTGTPSFLVADLADGVLGQTDGSTITLDLDAAGRGWFVDATPRDASEFPLVLGTDHLGAAPGSAAAGAMDLLTVLLHEIGHWAGYDHDAGIALMAPVLGAGQRVMLDIGNAPPAAGGSVPGLSLAGIKVDLTTAKAMDNNAGITVTINIDGTATVQSPHCRAGAAVRFRAKCVSARQGMSRAARQR